MEIFLVLWNEGIIRTMLNTLLVFYVLFFNQMGIAIIVFTLLIRLITLPLTLKQIRQMRAMTTLQPKMKEIQERYVGDRARISQETMKMYKEAGVSPLGCVGPLIIQLPILIGLFRVLIQVLPTNPDDLVGVADRLYAWVTFVPIHQAAPLNDRFLWLNLAEPDPTNIVLPVLVAASTWVQQKMTMTPSIDPRQQSTQNMMLWMMPMCLGVFSLGWRRGLPLYWIVCDAVGIGMLDFITGFGPLFPLFPQKPESASSQSQPKVQVKRDEAPEEIDDDGRTSNTNRQNRRRGRRTGSERARRRPQRGRGRNTK